MRVGCSQSDGVGSLKSWQTMKEAYAVRRTVPPSAKIQASIDKRLSKGMVDDPQKMLSELARLGARLIIQRAVEDEFDTRWARSRYERRPDRRSGPTEGVICAWGITEHGERALVSVRLGMRETKEDWLELGRDLTARGLPAPRLVVADGAAGLPSAVEEIWPRADRQHCAVHRLRNLCRRSCLSQSTTGSALTTGQRSPTRPRSRTASSDSRS